MFFKKKPIMLFRKRKNNDDIKKENDEIWVFLGAGNINEYIKELK